MPLKLVRHPAVEPISLVEAKLHLRVDITDDDLLITSMIAAARAHAEMLTHRAFVSQDWRYVFDSFPGPSQMGIPWGKTFTLPGHAVFLEKSGVKAISQIKYLDMSGVSQVMPAANYVVDYSSEPCRITPWFGQIWPIPLPQIGACEVDFTAGYAAPIVASTVDNSITVQGNWESYSVGDVIRLSNIGGALPVPLLPSTDYYIQSAISPGKYTLSANIGGVVIAITAAGTGTSLVGEIPDGIKSWMKLRVGSLYQHREEMFVTEKAGKVLPLAFVDKLLDPFIAQF